MDKENAKCRCIRCREIGRSSQVIDGYEIKVIKYSASAGQEFFIEAQCNDSLLGYCRLRFPSSSLTPEITDASAIIRELHVFGVKEQIGVKGMIGKSTQHIGIGKKLMKAAELIAEEHGKEKIVVISAVGTREYYKKLGYSLDGYYMSKTIC